MLIKLRTLYAGPKGCFDADSIVEFDKAEAKVLIKEGYAYPVGNDDWEDAPLELAADPGDDDAEKAAKKRK